MTDAALMQYFKFDDEDLAANRNGTLSERQRIRLEGERRTFNNAARMTGILIGIGALILLGVVIAMGVLDNSLMLQIVVPLLCVGPLGFAAYLIWGRFQPAHYTVQRVDGPAHLALTEMPNRAGMRVRRYTLKIGGRTFRATPELAEVMQEGERYRVYYTEDWEEVLSVERAG